jgi:2,4-dienoyl-CoA reductase-like NADH-dependent reductase (Old Yellow Enzyme family)
MTLPALFQPITLRGLTIRNRIAVSPMCQYVAVDGVPNEWHVAHHGRFALGGVGLVIAEATGVMRDGRISPGCTGLWTDEQEAAWARITALHRAHGVASAIQLNHSGAKGSTAQPWAGAGQLDPDAPDAWEIVAASAVPMRAGWRAPRPATVPELEAIVAAFGAAARRAASAGFDTIELHGAHGYLLHSFFSPLTNRREDAFGGSLEKRMRLPLLVAEEVRRAVPEAMPLLYRASVVDNAEGGLTVEDTVALALELKKRGVDLIDCSSGGGTAMMPPAPQAHGHQVHLAEEVHRGAGIPTMAVGLITDPLKANAVVAEGRADMVALGREMLADANWPYRAALATGHPAPESILPRGHGFFLERRAQAQGRPAASV